MCSTKLKQLIPQHTSNKINIKELKLLCTQDQRLVNLPTELFVRIFSLLPRNDLDECTLVCKKWKQIIDRHGFCLAQHRLGAIKFTSLESGWKAVVEYGYLCSIMKNKFKDEQKQFFGMPCHPDAIKATCGNDAFESLADSWCIQTHFDHLLGNPNFRNTRTSPKPFFWRWIKRKLQNSTSNLLIFFDCYITQDFVDNFSSLLSEVNGKSPYRVKQLTLHGCHLQNVDMNKLYTLLFERINASSYVFASISGCTKNQCFQFDKLANYAAVRNATRFHAFEIRGPMASVLPENGLVDDQVLSLILSEDSTFPNLESIQLPGHRLSRNMLSTFLTTIKQNSRLSVIQTVYLDNLQYQLLPCERWISLSIDKKQLKRYINDYFVVITHEPHRTTIFSQLC